jgi:site-specific recombinase XerD
MGMYAPASVNSMLAAVNRFFREQGWYDCIVKSMKIQRQSFRDKEREMTKGEYIQLLQTAKAQKNTRLYLLMQTICATGIRVSEVRFITVEAVRKEQATVCLKGKTSQVYLPEKLRSDLCLL